MYKIAVLGCENSHANTFLDFLIKEKKYPNIEVLGVYSEDEEAAKKVSEEYGLYRAASYDEFVGKLDGVIITARHGDNHFKYAKPYLSDGIPMFIDKPITISEEDACALYKELCKNKIPVCGGSVCTFSDLVQDMRRLVETQCEGKVYGGVLRAPMIYDNPYGGFFFYTQHLVEVMTDIFGYYPNTVTAYKNGDSIYCTVKYNEYDVNLLFQDGVHVYSASVFCENRICGGEYGLEGLFAREFESFNNALSKGVLRKGYKEFLAPVFILNAINRSLESGNEEPINTLN